MTDTASDHKPALKLPTYLKVVILISATISAIAIAIACLFAYYSHRSINTLNINQQTNNASLITKINDTNVALRQQQKNIDLSNNTIEQLTQLAISPERSRTLSHISYLINFANIALAISGDIDTCIHYLTLAKNQITDSSDAELIRLKRSINADLKNLTTLPSFNKSDLIIKLDNLSTTIQSLSIITPHKNITLQQQPNINNTHEKWYDKVWSHIKQLKNLVIIRHYDKKMSTLLDADQRQLLKNSIASKIDQCQWAVLNNNNSLYQHNLKIIASWINQYFYNANKIGQINLTIKTLMNINVNPKTPEITQSITAISRLIQDSQVSLQQKIQKPQAPAKNSKDNS